MIRKNYSKTGRYCRVTFDLTPGEEFSRVVLCGDFNRWNREVHPMKLRRDGRFSATLSLEAGRSYRFRYLLDGGRWENDWAADAYVPNDFGTEDSMINL